MPRLPSLSPADLATYLTISVNGVSGVGGNTPPGSPAEGAAYVVGSAPTGAWAGKANRLATYTDGAWVFVPAGHAPGASERGLTVDDAAVMGRRYRWSGSACGFGFIAVFIITLQLGCEVCDGEHRSSGARSRPNCLGLPQIKCWTVRAGYAAGRRSESAPVHRGAPTVSSAPAGSSSGLGR